jgi:hypothetical protein
LRGSCELAADLFVNQFVVQIVLQSLTLSGNSQGKTAPHGVTPG